MTSLATSFTARDRVGAVQHAIRMAMMDKRPYVIYFDYRKDTWAVNTVEGFNEDRMSIVCMSDVRIANANGFISEALG